MAIQTACLTNIQRYSLNDGPGIRTTVFLKGCPLGCQWCHNPECVRLNEEIYYVESKCHRCGLCNLTCPQKAVLPPNPDPLAMKIDREKCNLCMKCVDICPFGGLVKVGYRATIDEVLDEVRRDWPFYESTGGGVTLSGGEPLMQPEFSMELLKKCKEEGLHTCLETCSYGRWQVIEIMLPYVDLALCDIKHMDAEKHFEKTGVSNELVLQNTRAIASRVPVRIRVPLIPGFNDSAEHTRTLAEYIKSLGNIQGVDILPFHSWAEPKYRKLEKPYTYATVLDMNDEEARKVESIFKQYGFQTTVGG